MKLLGLTWKFCKLGTLAKFQSLKNGCANITQTNKNNRGPIPRLNVKKTNKMSTFQLEALEDFFVLNSNKEFYVRKYGYVLKIEERLDGHLYRSMNVHAGGDTLDCAILDCQAIAKDYGKELKLDENW